MLWRYADTLLLGRSRDRAVQPGWRPLLPRPPRCHHVPLYPSRPLAQASLTRYRPPRPLHPQKKAPASNADQPRLRPFLADLLRPYLPLRAPGRPPNVLELFARTAMAGPEAQSDESGRGVWVGVGNEACKFNVVDQAGMSGVRGWLRSGGGGTRGEDGEGGDESERADGGGGDG